MPGSYKCTYASLAGFAEKTTMHNFNGIITFKQVLWAYFERIKISLSSADADSNIHFIRE